MLRFNLKSCKMGNPILNYLIEPLIPSVCIMGGSLQEISHKGWEEALMKKRQGNRFSECSQWGLGTALKSWFSPIKQFVFLTSRIHKQIIRMLYQQKYYLLGLAWTRIHLCSHSFPANRVHCHHFSDSIDMC